MARGQSADEDFGQALAALIQFLVSPASPFLLFSVCGISYLLTNWLHVPEFGLWPKLATMAFGYAQANIWAAIVFGLLALAAIPLLVVAFREAELLSSRVFVHIVAAAAVIAFIVWLRGVWPHNRSIWQDGVYAFLLLFAWATVLDCLFDLVGIVVYVRANRRPKVKPPAQQPHGPQADLARPPGGLPTRTTELETI